MIQADPATNSLIISAPDPLYRNIRSIIDRLDVRPAQVMIESLVVEVSGDKAAEFGIQWQALNGVGDTNGPAHVVGGTNFGSGATNIVGLAQNITAPAPGLNLGIIKGQINIAGTVITNVGLLARALETTANANILSRPNIQTLDNEEGKFLVGQNVPFVTGAYAATGTNTASTVNPFQTFERRDVGLQLQVKPQVSEGGVVRLAIYVEDSSVAPGTAGDALVLNKRSFQTNVIVEDGSFVVISGLIQDQANETRSKVPLLGDLPLIGNLFRYDTRTRTKTQTMVFLRPTIIRDEAAAAEIALDRYDYMRTQVEQSRQPNHLVLPNLSVDPLPLAPPPRPQSKRPAPPDRGVSDSTPVAPQQPADPPQQPALGGPATAQAAAVVPTPPTPADAQASSSTTVAKAPSYQLIQVLAVNEIARGRQLEKRLKDAGLDAYWESVHTGDGDVIRIRVTVERRASKIADALSTLRRLGYDPILVGQ